MMPRPAAKRVLRHALLWGLVLAVAACGGERAVDCGDSWSAVQGASRLESPQAISAVADDDVWVVGSKSIRNGGIGTGAVHWDGEDWTSHPTPNLVTGKGYSENALLDVAADEGNAWAVGYKSGDQGYSPLVIRNDGRGWREVRTPAFGEGDNVLTSVSTSTGGDVWAAGYYVEGTTQKPLTLRTDGGAWR